MANAITRLQLLGDRADELTKWQAGVELDEANYKREQARKKREAERQRDEQQQGAARFSEAWYARVDERIAQHFAQRFDRDAQGNIGPMTDAIGAVIGHARAKMRREFEAAIDKLRGELTTATTKLHDELERRHAADQERRELERALLQSKLDAGNARIDGAIEAATVKLRSEFDVAGIANELHAELRRRLPVVEPWEPERVFYRGAIVTHNNSCYQARKDTGQPPDHQDWACVARGGRDGRDGATFNIRGTYDVHATYARFDIVECAGASYLACRDKPGACPPLGPEDGWQVLSGSGSCGPEGAVGPRGRKGERGPRGETVPTIVSWVLDPVHYRVALTMSDGKAGPVLDLRPLFEQFNNEVNR